MRPARPMTMGLACTAFAIAGCADTSTRFEITNHRAVGETEYFHESFDECYYTIAASGNVDVVARRRLREGGDQAGLTQIVHLRTMFRAIPGRTYAESSMINGIVNYAIIGPHGGACYEGTGFVSCAENRDGRTLAGALEQSKLRPNRRVGNAGDIFAQAELTGAFHATRNARKVVSILNELRRFFGPQPRYEPPDRVDPM